VTLSEVSVASDSLLILRELVGVGVLVCESSLDSLGRWMGVSAMVRAVLRETIVSACFDNRSAVRQLGFENAIFESDSSLLCVVAVYGAASVRRPKFRHGVGWMGLVPFVNDWRLFCCTSTEAVLGSVLVPPSMVTMVGG
jgi:hypothetical protein